MPYNNTPIAPSKEVTGTVALPLARVKKIISQDDDISNCSNNAAFVITVATEMFLQHLVEQSHNVVKSERKPRRNIQYRDVANAVARVENLEFLTDVVPKTQSFKQVKQKQAKESAAKTNGIANGQKTLDSHVGGEDQATNGATHDPESMDVDEQGPSGATAPIGKLGSEASCESQIWNDCRPSFKATTEIDLVEQPCDWISGFDSGFGNRPFVSGNSHDYTQGYIDGQMASCTPTASSSLALSAANDTNFGPLEHAASRPGAVLQQNAQRQHLIANSQTEFLNTQAIPLDVSSGYPGYSPPLFALPNEFACSPANSYSESDASYVVRTDAQKTYAAPSLNGPEDTLLRPANDFPDTSQIASLACIGSPAQVSLTPERSADISTQLSVPSSNADILHPLTVAPKAQLIGRCPEVSSTVQANLSAAHHARVESRQLVEQGDSDGATQALALALLHEKKARRRHAQNQSQRKLRAMRRTKP
ncbi:hypothetical protein Q7P37_006790 [Cladosporium fusiforme]